MKTVRKLFVILSFAFVAASSFSHEIQNGVLTIKDGTTELKYREFYSNKEIKKIIFPNTVTTIGNSTFNECSNLTEVTIPSSVTSIGKWAFERCTSLTKITIPSSVTSIGERAFNGCTNLKEIVIPSSVETIGKEVVKDCPNLTTIRVDKYSEAHTYFSGDSRLAFTNNKPTRTKEQWIASSKKNIVDDGVLYVANGVTKISDNQYKDNKEITEIRFSATTEKIGTAAFKNNTGLKKIVFPKTFTAIADNAFNGCSNLEEVVFEEGIETLTLHGNAFANCTKLNSVTLPKSIKEIKADGILSNKNTRIFHCYLGSAAQQTISSKGYKVDIIGIDEKNVANIDLSYLAVSGNKTINAGLFKNLPFEMIDLNNDITAIGKNAFNDKTIIRVKRNTGGDKCMKANGYYLCEVLADLNFYTKDKSKQIKEDFTRILCDDDPYLNWTSYKIKIQQPLQIEEVDGKVVLTSFLLYPCEDVTVTRNGKTLFSNKKIQPLTRTVLCDAEPSMNLEDFKVSSDDMFYQIFTNMKIDWTVSFNGNYFRPTDSGNTEVLSYLPMYPVYCREWLATICNHAYVFASKEYEDLCYEYVEEEWLFTDPYETRVLSKDEMEMLLGHCRDRDVIVGLCDGGGLGTVGGNYVWLLGSWFRNLGKSGEAFYHEFSHNMGYEHSNGNMCNDGSNHGWPGVGSKVFQQLFKDGELPYTDLKLLNSDLFSYEEFQPTVYGDDVVKDGVLYIAEGVTGTNYAAGCGGGGEYENRDDFTKIVFPSSLTIIGKRAFAYAKIEEIDIPPTVRIIDDGAFQCNPLTETIVIPEGVVAIGTCAFIINRIPKIVVPESVKQFGENITEQNVTWVVKRGSAAYEYALKNSYRIEIQDETPEEAAAYILKEKALMGPKDSWKKGDFPTYYERFYWDFSKFLNGAGKYVVTFKNTGYYWVCFQDALFMADGKLLSYFPAGSGKMSTVYSVNVPAGTKKLELYVLAYSRKGTDSSGTITVQKR